MESLFSDPVREQLGISASCDWRIFFLIFFFGTNVLVLGKERDNYPLLSEPLKPDVNTNVVIERFLN